MNNEDVAAGNGVLEEDDTQYMQAQDPGYLLYMMKEAEAYYNEQKAKEHSDSMKAHLERMEMEEWYRREEAYWVERDEQFGEDDEG